MHTQAVYTLNSLPVGIDFNFVSIRAESDQAALVGSKD
jgi:hypothetical protein